MDDGEFRSSAAEVALSLARGHVKGVHEERLPLQLQALLTAGCVTSLVPAARSRAISEGFTLTDLQVSFRRNSYHLMRKAQSSATDPESRAV